MQKEVVVALEGFEDYFEYLKGKIENLESEKQAEIEKLVREVDEKYENKFEKVKKLFAEVSDVKYEEIPEEEIVDEQVEVTEEPLEA